MFTSELFKEIELDQPEVTFLKLSSYEGTDTTGQVKKLIGLNEPIRGRTLVVLEDIIDTGVTIVEVMKMFNKVLAPFAGTIEKVLVEDDGVIIAKGQTLFKIKPDEEIIIEAPETIAARKREYSDGFLALN